MENQKPQQPSAQSTPVKSAPQTTPTVNAPSAAIATTLSAEQSVPESPVGLSAQPVNKRPKEECIILVKAPNGTVHPLVNPPGQPAGCRVFDTAELAVLEQTTNTKLAKLPSIVVQIGELL